MKKTEHKNQNKKVTKTVTKKRKVSLKALAKVRRNFGDVLTVLSKE